MKTQHWLFVVALSFVFCSCKEEYEPKVIPPNTAFLVVEGFLNSGAGPTSISLSQTTPLSDALVRQPVGGAQLMVEGKDGRTYPLHEGSAGTYISNYLGITAGAEYRLLINLQDGKKYRSDFIMAKETPAIDSITWRRSVDGVELAVTTHDPANNTKYYRWDYEETWEIRSRYYSRVKYVNNSVIDRDPVTDNVFNCWRIQPNTSIMLGTTTGLDADLVYKKALLMIPPASEKISVRYSILVKQYALDQAGYEFLQVMKKNTETLGSIFDAQPSEVRGNIHSVSEPDELVIGYVTASSVTEKRLFISNAELPEWNYEQPCTSFLVANHPDSFSLYYPGFLPYEPRIEGRSITHYYSADRFCVDCTLRGTNVKPSFW